MDTPDTATLPRTCLDIHMATPAAPDGTYTLYHDSVAYAIYCAHMATAPTEYLTLPTSGGGSNVFSTYDSPANTVVTRFTKVRLDPQTFAITIADFSFSQSSGVIIRSGTPYTQTAYASAGGCVAPYTLDGRGAVNLVGTSFAISDTFTTIGYEATGSATFYAAKQGVVVRGGGFCGAETPGDQQALHMVYVGPLITGVNPSHSAGGGLTQVAISGSGFTNVLAVRVGGVALIPRTSLIVNSAGTRILMTIPHISGSGNADIQVVTIAGLSAPTPADLFTYGP